MTWEEVGDGGDYKKFAFGPFVLYIRPSGWQLVIVGASLWFPKETWRGPKWRYLTRDAVAIAEGKPETLNDYLRKHNLPEVRP